MMQDAWEPLSAHDPPHGIKRHTVGESGVEQHDVRLDLGSKVHDLVPVGSDAHELEARILLEPRVQRARKHTTIVNDQDSHDGASVGWGGTRHWGLVLRTRDARAKPGFATRRNGTGGHQTVTEVHLRGRKIRR